MIFTRIFFLRDDGKNFSRFLKNREKFGKSQHSRWKSIFFRWFLAFKNRQKSVFASLLPENWKFSKTRRHLRSCQMYLARDFSCFENPSEALRMPYGFKIFLELFSKFFTIVKHNPEGVVDGTPQLHFWIFKITLLKIALRCTVDHTLWDVRVACSKNLLFWKANFCNQEVRQKSEFLTKVEAYLVNFYLKFWSDGKQKAEKSVQRTLFPAFCFASDQNFAIFSAKFLRKIAKNLVWCEADRKIFSNVARNPSCMPRFLEENFASKIFSLLSQLFDFYIENWTPLGVFLRKIKIFQFRKNREICHENAC